MKNWSFMTMINTKGSEVITMNLFSLPQRRSFIEEKLWRVYGGITGIIHFEFLECVGGDIGFDI